MAAPVAADVGPKFDVLINGKGYMIAPSDVGLPPSIFGVKTKYEFTPTFISRQNTSGDFGDNQQDFWLTATQRDWSLGEQQRYFRSGDADSIRRYWAATIGVDPISMPGEVAMGYGTVSKTASITPIGYGRGNAAGVCYIADSTNLYEVSPSATTSKGAHGVGATPTGFAHDGQYLYLSKESGGKVRKWSGAAFSDFAATTGAARLLYLNNTLYGLNTTAGASCGLVKWDTTGTQSSVFQWKGAEGSTGSINALYMEAYGGKIVIVVQNGTDYSLWIYDGTGVSKLLDFDPNFLPLDIAVAQGNVYIPGFLQDQGAQYPSVFTYANGSTSLLWKSRVSIAGKFNCVPWAAGIAINDTSTGSLLYYNATTGSITTIGTTAVGVGTANYPLVSSDTKLFVFDDSSTTYFAYPTSPKPASVTLTTSLFDFDSSLKKLFRGIKVEFISATDGNGGTVDIAYRIGDTDGAYTSLISGGTSGSEVLLSGVSGPSISIKVTLNKGTSTLGPRLHRISVRAVPLQTNFAKGQYVLLLQGQRKRDPLEGQMMQLHDGTIHNKDGNQMAADLITAANSLTPISITDQTNGTMTNCVIDSDNFEITQLGGRVGEYVAVVGWRQV